MSEQTLSPAAILTGLLAQAPEIPVRLSATQLAAFARYADELLSWNERMNLTAITDPDDIATRHFLDSLALLLALPDRPGGAGVSPARNGATNGQGRLAHAQLRHKAHQDRDGGREAPGMRLLDVGAGAGFPGVPLAIVRPEWAVTLLEATQKKVHFLEHLVATLDLRNVRIVTGRAEEVAHERRHRGRYDAVVARGLAALPVLLEYCTPFCRPGGLVVAPKKGDIAAEVAQGRRAAAALGAVIREVRPVALPGLMDDRALVVAEQRQRAPAIYPRAAGAPRTRPLGG
jgi:16S rRNA (guanine527-N7)-methyltransferase